MSVDTYYIGGKQEKFLNSVGFSDVCSAKGRMVFAGGQVGQAPDGTVAEGLREQAFQATENVKTALAKAGGKMEHVVQVMIFLAESVQGQQKEWWKIVTDLNKQYYAPHLPCGTGFWIKELAHPSLLVEIQVIAVVPD